MLPFGRMLEYGNIKPSPATIEKIYGQYFHVAIKMSNGTYYMRGVNANGQLATGNYVSITTYWNLVKPPASDSTPIIDMYMGFETSYMWTEQALYVAGKMRALGGGVDYKLPMWATFTMPGSYSTASIKKVQASQDSTFMLMDDGNLYACGQNSAGEFGLGNLTASPSFILVNTNVKDIFLTGISSTPWLIKNDDTVWRCGYGLNGELVNGTKANSRNWTQLVMPSGRTIKEFLSQSYCVVMLLTNTSTGSTEFWYGGFMRYGNAGNGSTAAVLSLTQNTNIDMIGEIDSFFRSKTSQDSLTMIKNTSGTVYVAGSNSFYPLGQTVMGNTFVPISGLPSNPTVGGAIAYYDGFMLCGDKLYHSGTQKLMYNDAHYVWTEDETVPK